MKPTAKFFLGANSHKGFCSYFSQLQEKKHPPRLIILKGGPGSGKSSLMKKVLSHILSLGHDVEMIPCASDPKSLDAVIDHTKNFAIMDGTAPHAMDPLLPGAQQHILNMGDLWDSKKLAFNCDSIAKLTELIGDCHKGACSYINAAHSLLCENERISKKYINQKEALTLALDISGNFLRKKAGGETKRLLSAVSVDGIEFFTDTVSVYADKVFVISDEWGGLSDYIMNKVYSAATLAEEEIIYCPCSISPEKCDHLIFPDSRLAVLKDNSFLKIPYAEKINAYDYYFSIPMQHSLKKRKESASGLLLEAGKMISDAKFLHDELEAFYVSAMNFERTNALYEDIKNRFC